MKKFLYLAPLFTLLLIGSSYSSDNANPSDSREEKELITINKGSFTSSLKLVGDIEAKKQIYLAPAFSAKVEKLAEDGEKVSKGDLIARLESKELVEELNDTEMEAGIAKNDLMQMEKDSAAELIKLDANVLLAGKNLELKKLELKKLTEQPTPEELKKLDINVKLSKKSLGLANDELSQKNILYGKGILKKKDILEQELTVARKEKDYQVAGAEYILTKAGPTDISKEIARLEVKKAENNLQIEKNNLILRKEQIALEKSKIKIRVNVMQKNVEQIKGEISEAVIKAPTDGTVVISKIYSDSGLEKVKEGDNIYKGRPFVSIANLDNIVIKAQIDEQFIGKIQKGMPCNISLSSLKGKSFKGKISRIGLLAGEKKGEKYIEGSGKVFDLDIDLEKTSNIFKTGMSVDIEIVLKSFSKVLLIPNKAVFKEGDKNFVYLPGGEKKFIKLGLSNADESIVENGLEFGEQIVIDKKSSEGT